MNKSHVGLKNSSVMATDFEFDLTEKFIWLRSRSTWLVDDRTQKSLGNKPRSSNSQHLGIRNT